MMQNFENDVKMNFAKEEFRWMNPNITIFVHDAVLIRCTLTEYRF